jgi:hypothetical protein
LVIIVISEWGTGIQCMLLCIIGVIIKVILKCILKLSVWMSDSRLKTQNSSHLSWTQPTFVLVGVQHFPISLLV